jgi:hypothetical protein
MKSEEPKPQNPQRESETIGRGSGFGICRKSASLKVRKRSNHRLINRREKIKAPTFGFGQKTVGHKQIS